MKHAWWHDSIAGRYYAVATDDAGRIVSAWMHVGGNRWEAIDGLDGFGPLEGAHARDEMHVNTDPDGFTDELGPSVLPH